MKLKVIKRFNDLKQNKILEVKTVFDAEKERAEILLKKGYVEKVEDVKAENGKTKTQ